VKPPCGVSDIRASRVREGDLVLVELYECCDLEEMDELRDSFDDLAHETGAAFLVVPENLIKNIKSMSLSEMVTLQTALEEQIESQVQRDTIGEG